MELSQLISHLNDSSYNYIILPVSILNIIECDTRFSYATYDNIDGLTRVGNFLWYDVYLDILMPPNEVLLSFDLKSSRDNKIDFLLNDSTLLKEKSIKF